MNHFKNMPFSEYKAVQALNSSTIINGTESMKHMRHYMDAPHNPTPLMIKGARLHTAVLEPEAVAVNWIVWPHARNSNKWKDFKSANPGKEILTQPEYDEVILSRDVILNDPRATEYMDSQKEVCGFWLDDRGPYKMRIDLYSPGNFICDIKNTNDISHFSITKTFANFGYHIKLGFYQIGVKWITGDKDYLPVWVIGVESKPPYDISVDEYDSDALAYGREIALGLVARYYECMESGEWPGKSPDIRAIKLPSYLTEGDEPLVLNVGGEQIEIGGV